MKRIIVGRGIDCDIVIPDEKDNVSRHHLVISFGVFGKMTISDTSSNGTYVNDRKLLKGASVPVTREDKVRLGSQWSLDWSLVKDPYVATRRILLGIVVFCVLALIGGGVWYYKSSQLKVDEKVEIPVSKENEQDDVWTKDSTNKIAPKDDAVKIEGLKKVSPKKEKTEMKHSSAKNKERNHKVKKVTNKKECPEKLKEVNSEKMPILN
ncbi:FHA domain-containing protein [Prevotella sp.]|uniref:FHA domain-containing protein n=1 Tax=Prevotella sp. TaxID=59823 RepID=UPI003078C3BE